MVSNSAILDRLTKLEFELSEEKSKNAKLDKTVFYLNKDVKLLKKQIKAFNDNEKVKQDSLDVVFADIESLVKISKKDINDQKEELKDFKDSIIINIESINQQIEKRQKKLLKELKVHKDDSRFDVEDISCNKEISSNVCNTDKEEQSTIIEYKGSKKLFKHINLLKIEIQESREEFQTEKKKDFELLDNLRLKVIDQFDEYSTSLFEQKLQIKKNISERDNIMINLKSKQVEILDEIKKSEIEFTRFITNNQKLIQEDKVIIDKAIKSGLGSISENREEAKIEIRELLDELVNELESKHISLKNIPNDSTSVPIKSIFEDPTEDKSEKPKLYIDWDD